MKKKKLKQIDNFKMKFKSKKNPRQMFKIEKDRVVRDSFNLKIYNQQIKYYNKK